LRHAGYDFYRMDHTQIDVKIFHPADEGWTLAFKYLPQILPDHLNTVTASPEDSIKTSCKSPGWFDRLSFSDHDIAVFKVSEKEKEKRKRKRK
jgi:hypothetical protein